MPTLPSYEHWIELIISEGVISFRLYTINHNTNIVVSKDYSIPNPPPDLVIKDIFSYIEKNFDMISAENSNISKLL